MTSTKRAINPSRPPAAGASRHRRGTPRSALTTTPSLALCESCSKQRMRADVGRLVSGRSEPRPATPGMRSRRVTHSWPTGATGTELRPPRGPNEPRRLVGARGWRSRVKTFFVEGALEQDGAQIALVRIGQDSQDRLACAFAALGKANRNRDRRASRVPDRISSSGIKRPCWTAAHPSVTSGPRPRTQQA